MRAAEVAGASVAPRPDRSVGRDRHRAVVGHRVPLARVTLAVGALRHTLYDSDGRIVSCGDGPFGQLGDGMSGLAAHSGTPVAVRGLPAV
jgi:hypothetical protein